MEFIEENRKLKGITVTELTKRIGVSRRIYYNWVNGEKKPKLENVYKMCEVLGIEFNIKDFI